MGRAGSTTLRPGRLTLSPGPARLPFMPSTVSMVPPGETGAPALRDRDLTVLDLFAGAGGLTEAFRRTEGFRVVCGVESDPNAAATYAANHGDIVEATTIQEWLASRDVPEVDVVVGGPPCQGFSTLGLQDPADLRSRLWNEYVEAVLRAGPSFFVLENVGAFTRAPQYEALAAEVSPGGRLHDYDFIVDVLNAADYGTPQVRKRTVFIGFRRGHQPPKMPHRTHEGHHESVREAFKRRSVVSKVTYRPLVSRRSARDAQGEEGLFTSVELHVDRTYSAVSKARFRCIPEGGNRHDLPDYLKAPCWQDFTTGASDVMGRLRWDRPSVTIRTEFVKPEKGRYLHPVEHRAITIYEGAVLQGFPDDYLWAGTRTNIARQIGNAVPIELGRAIARGIRDEAQYAGMLPQDGFSREE